MEYTSGYRSDFSILSLIILIPIHIILGIIAIKAIWYPFKQEKLYLSAESVIGITLGALSLLVNLFIFYIFTSSLYSSNIMI